MKMKMKVMMMINALLFVILAQVCFVQCDSFVGDYFSNKGGLSLIQYDVQTLKEVSNWVVDPTVFTTACYMQSERLYYILTQGDNGYLIFSLNITSGEKTKAVPFLNQPADVIFMECDPVFGLAIATVDSSDAFTLYIVNYTTASSKVIATRDNTSYILGSVGLDIPTHTLYFQNFNEDFDDTSENSSFVLISLSTKNVTVLNYFSYISSFESSVYLPKTNSFVGLNVTWKNELGMKSRPFTYIRTEKGLVKRKNSELGLVFFHALVTLSYSSTSSSFKQIGEKVKYPNNDSTWAVGTLYTSSNTLVTLVSSNPDKPLYLSCFLPNGTHYLSSSSVKEKAPFTFIQYIPDN